VICRSCATPLIHSCLDLGASPPSNSFLTRQQCDEPETCYPLRLQVCHKCFLVQMDEYVSSAKIFCGDYVYFSSFSSTWVEHARTYAEMITARLGLHAGSLVIEAASNDGYLLRHFKTKGIGCLGLEPALNTARAARALGIEVITEFFGREQAGRLARQGRKADLFVGNNVLAHVPDINDFTGAIKEVLAPEGVATLEFPHLMRLVEGNQFDTVYHEHFSYLSLIAVTTLFERNGLRIFDVEELPTHGGSLRVYACLAEGKAHSQGPAVEDLLRRETQAGMRTLDYYACFQGKLDTVKNDLLAFLLECKRASRTVAGYGAAAKGNTLFNYAGVKKDLVAFVADRSPHKQGLYLPGSRIPVLGEEDIHKLKPDFVLILPWNIQAEITAQLAGIRRWGGRFAVAIPSLRVLD
jgi:SAM-dependent methyltransferase